MNQKHLLKFIKKTLDEDGKKKVCVKDGKELTLEEVFETYVWKRNPLFFNLIFFLIFNLIDTGENVQK